MLYAIRHRVCAPTYGATDATSIRWHFYIGDSHEAKARKAGTTRAPRRCANPSAWPRAETIEIANATC
jgi:hypothetical protein